MDDNDLDSDATRAELLWLNGIAGRVQQSVDYAFRQYPQMAKWAYPHTSRVKSVHRSYDKMLRLHSEGRKISPQNLPDLVAFRLVTYFQSGIFEIIKFLIGLAQHTVAVKHPSPFVKDDIRHIRLFTSRPPTDPLSVAERLSTLVDDLKLKEKWEPAETDRLYSSVHLVFSCSIDAEDVHGRKITVALPVELQVRTAFEDAWGQISHTLNYGQSNSASRLWTLHLNALKAVVDGCIQYAEVIREESGFDGSVFDVENESLKSVKLVDSDEILSHPRLPRKIRNAFLNGIRLRDDAKKLEEGDNATANFLAAAIAFDECYKLVLHRPSLADIQKTLLYWSKMEYAFCLMHSNNESELPSVISAYLELSEHYKDDPVCRYRLGQAYRRAQKMEPAMTAFKHCAALLEELEKNGGGRIQTDNWIYSATFRDLGYVHWRIGSALADNEQRLKEIQQAVDCTRRAMSYDKIQDQDELVRNSNNFVYYAWEERNAPSGGPFIISDEEMRHQMQVLESKINIKIPGIDDYSVLDTLCRGYDCLGDDEKAREIAVKLSEILSEKVRKRIVGLAPKRPDAALIQQKLNPDEFDAYSFAMALISEWLRSKN